MGAAATFVDPIVGTAKGLMEPASSVSERITNGIVGGAKKFDNVGAQIGGAKLGTKIGAGVGAGVGALGGGVGAAPGAVVGGALGGIGGAIAADVKYKNSALDKRYDAHIESQRKIYTTRSKSFHI